ncbi:MAG: membrane protein insertion efficiency factor YidD [Clostridia bacterium]|nr:membrane protein insertion efficiency factor YidD [Clostridia bacterium]
MKKIAVFFIRLYQRGISPLVPPCCRFVPTCSSYAIEALERFGFFRGMALSVCRFCRCNPFFEGGYDPVPLTWDDVKRRKKK